MAFRLKAVVAILFCAAGACTTTEQDIQTKSAPSREELASIPASVTLVEQVRAAGDEIVIPYEKFRLPNGLTVILHEDHSDPLVHVDVTYHVGSAREEIGKSGFAHFFEHMMFQGSENVADEVHFKIISEAGGTLNGTTNTDRTNYFETVPANHLETMLWLESDRMGFLLPAVTQRKFEVQRATVKNERGQNYDNRPYGLLGERVGEALYPEGHPYSWQTIGYVEDLDRVDVNDLKAFFLRWYGPNNATLTVGGDFDRTQTLEWIVKYFGSIPRGPEVANPEKPKVSLDQDRYISMEDNITLPLIQVSIPTVYARHPDEAPLDVLMSILGTGKTSLLYQNLVRNGLAVQANAGHRCAELACSFTLTALPNPANGTSLASIERIFDETLAEFEQRGVTQTDIDKMSTRIVAGMIYGLESVSGKVSQLAANETFTGNPNYIGEDIARYESVTPADVMRVYEVYIKDKPAVIMSIVPKGHPEMVAAPDTWQRLGRTLPQYAAIDESELEFRTPDDNFDRSMQPLPGPVVTTSLPELWHATLENGVRVIGAVSSEIPTTTITVRTDRGTYNQPIDKLGVAPLAGAMLNEATMDSTAEELSERLQSIGSSVSFSTGQDNSGLSIRTLTEHLDETIDIASEQFFIPAFREDDFARLKDQTIQEIRQREKDAGALAGMARRIALYGHDNAFAYPGSGLEETVNRLTVDDVKEFYELNIVPALTDIIVVSDLPKAEVLEKLDRFGNWPIHKFSEPKLEPYPDLPMNTLYLINKTDAAQSEIRIAKRALTYDATGDFYKAGLMNFPLGGSFNSRINLNLREDKGYTYGASSGFGGNAYAGAFTASAGVRADATGASIIEFFKEIDTYLEEGMTEEELDYTRNSVSQREARAYETPGKKAGLISEILTYDLPDDFKSEQGEILKSVDRRELNALAREYLGGDDFIVIVVGDKESVRPQLEPLGFNIVEVDSLLRPVGWQGSMGVGISSGMAKELEEAEF